MIKILDAIIAIDSNAEVTVRGEDLNKIEWSDGNPNGITVEQIQAKQSELQNAYDNDYSRKRKAEYPTTDDLVVALWEAGIEERMASSIDLQGKRTAVKNKYPKP